MNKNACAYIRVSTDQQTELSPDAQIRLLKEYCRNNDLYLGNIYKDLGVSGRKAEKRPGFQQMISDCKASDHPYDVILVWKFSRFARNQEEAIVYKSLLKKDGIDVISVSEPLPDGAVGELVERIFEWMDEYYSIRLSGEVVRGMTENAMRGGYNANAPYGYRKNRGETPVVFPDEAKVVHMIFDMFCDGSSYGSIASKINSMGIRTSRGGKWETKTISYLIKNPFYIGKIRWNYYDRSNYSYKSKEEQIIVDGQHSPIISIAQWNMAQKRVEEIEERYSYMKDRGKPAATARHWLCGILKCPSCGGTMAYHKILSSKKNSVYHEYLKCYKGGKGKCDNPSSVRLDHAEKLVMDYLKNMRTTIGSSSYSFVKRENTSIESKIEILKSELKKLSSMERRAKDAYLSGVDSLDEYKHNKKTIQERQEEIQREIFSCSNPKTQERKEDLLINEMEDVLKSFSDLDVESQSEIMRDIFKAIYYDKNTDSMRYEIYM